MEITLFTKCVFEFFGTMIMILLGYGVCAACTLNKTKAQGAGWIVITIAWGFAVMCGVFIAGPYSGAHLNPAVTLGLAMAGKFAWSAVLPYAIAQMLGGFVGAIIMYTFYIDHFAATSDNPDGMLGCFCTAPAISHKTINLFSEIIATFVLVFLILALSTSGNQASICLGEPIGQALDKNAAISLGLGSIGAIPITMVIMSLGMSLGATTGYAMNPARDLSPRIAHAILPIRGKRDSNWGYGWIPVAGPLTGGALAAIIFLTIY